MAQACDERFPLEIWAIVPVKPLAQAKTRLAGVLSPVAREALVTRLLLHTLEVLTQVAGLAGVLVVSADERVGALAQAQGAVWLREENVPGLNVSLARATSALQEWGAAGVLVIPADLPRLNPRSVMALLEAAVGSPVVALAGDRQQQGTNALLLVPSTVIPFSFGEDSLRRHLALARAVGARVRVFEDVDLAVDVDQPEDLVGLMLDH